MAGNEVCKEKNPIFLVTGSFWHGPHPDLFLRWIMRKKKPKMTEMEDSCKT